MKLAIVTACPSGRVSSVLSARLLDAAARRQGWSTSVEVFDPQNPEQRLTEADIEAAGLGAGGQHRCHGLEPFRRQASVSEQPGPRPAGCRRFSAAGCRTGQALRSRAGGSRNGVACTASGGGHRLPDRGRAYLHGGRSVTAGRQAVGLRVAGGNPGFGGRAQPVERAGPSTRPTWCCWPPISKWLPSVLLARRSIAAAPALP